MRIKNIAKFWLQIFLCILSTGAFAQLADTIEVQRNEHSKKVTFARFSNATLNFKGHFGL